MKRQIKTGQEEERREKRGVNLPFASGEREREELETESLLSLSAYESQLSLAFRPSFSPAEP